MKAKDFVLYLDKKGFGCFAGVPCTILSPIIGYIENHADMFKYVAASNEGEAMGVAAGFSLSGKIPVVMMQNSGLGNTINPITSLTMLFKLKTLIIVSLRGEIGKKDEPQHEIMGQVTEKLLEVLKIKYAYVDDSNYKDTIDDMYEYINKNDNIAALIIRENQFEKYTSVDNNQEDFLNRRDVIRAVVKNAGGHNPIIASTGKIARELYYCSENQANNFYTLGSMGCASAIALGIALSNKDKRVIVLDGDGAVLMKLGNLSTIGSQKLNNLLHIVLDNESYDSTGGQKSNSPTTKIHEIAKNCGYDRTYHVTEFDKFNKIVQKEFVSAGCALILVKVSSGKVDGIGRPKESPVFLKDRFMTYLKSDSVG